MIGASQAFSDAVSAYTRKFRMKLYDSQDTEIAGEIRSARIHTGSTGPDTFQIGAVYSSFAEIVIDGQSTNLEGKELRMEIGVLTSGNTYSDIVLGYYTVLAPSATKHRTTFTAVGRIAARLEKTDFEAPATQTLASVAGAIQTLTGVMITFQSVIDTTGVIEHPIQGTCRDALGVLASIVGGYATETNTGEVLISLYNCTPDVDWSPETMNTLPEMADYDFEITGVQAVTETGVYESGDPVNVTVDNNYITEDLFDDFAAALIGVEYRPGTVRNALGDPRIEASDVVRVTIDGTAYVYPCMSVTHIYDGGLQTEITTPAVQHTGEITGLLSKEARAAMQKAKQAITDADDAKKVAVNYLSRDITGIMVADMSDGTAYTPSTVPSGVKNTFIDDDSFDVRDGQTVLASFGTVSQIGSNENLRLRLLNDGLYLISAAGDPLIKLGSIGNIRKQKTKEIVIDVTRDYEMQTLNFPITVAQETTATIIINTITTVTLTIGTEYAGSSGDVSVNYDGKTKVEVELTRGSNDIEMSYYVDELDACSFLLGTLNDSGMSNQGSLIGDRSIMIGECNIATHNNAGTIGTALKTGCDMQFVIGEANTAESRHAFEIGAGESAIEIIDEKTIHERDEESTANAFAVGWDGDIEMALDVNAASSTIDGKLYAAITALGWESDVIV